MLVLPPNWRQAADPFAAIMALQGEIFRQQPGRRTLRFQQQGKSYFAKLHFGVGWLEIIKNLLYGRLPILGAKTEWQALQRLQQLSIATPELVAYGERGLNPAAKQSFIITKALTATLSLEELGQEWQQQAPAFTLKRRLIKAVAEIARTLHKNGINHRDFYLCHFLLDRAAVADQGDIKLYLIDLHRAQIRRCTPQRWIIKDLSGLWFSAMDCGLTRKDLLYFIKHYQGASQRRRASLQNKSFWQKIQRKALKLYQKSWQRSPILPC